MPAEKPKFDIVGKTINKVTKLKAIGHDDTGWLRLDFTDGSAVVIEAGYCCYTGDSLGEYPTNIVISSTDVIDPDDPEEGEEDWAWKGLEEVVE